jgi:hypothetical protein
MVKVVLSAGPPPVSVPDVTGQPAAAAEGRLEGAGLRHRVTLVPAPESEPGVVLRQDPQPGVSIPRRSAVSLSVSEAPRWREVTTRSGVDDGESAPFRIRGGQWRVVYSMGYRGSCLLLVVCFGPSAEALNLQTGSRLGGFDLGEGGSETHTFASGPGLYSLKVSGGSDSAHWSMTVEDYY